MSQQNGFGNGFILGSIVGGVIGGLLGAVLANRNEESLSQTDHDSISLKRQNSPEIGFTSEESMELARHGLEDKIAQLNLAIDDVRQQLGTVRTNSLDNDAN